jgi:exodeoxyribonuclease VII large subunit
VVSAIGHEPDIPLLDLVADLRASTPTDAAKQIVPAVAEELAALAGVRERARLAVAGRIEREARALEALRSRPVLARPTSLVDDAERVVADQRDRARRSLRSRLDRAGDEVGHHLARVRGLSPLATLERGYAVAQLPDGSVVTRTAQVSADDQLTVRVVDGTVIVRTLSIEETPSHES